MMASFLIIRTPSQRINDLEVELCTKWNVLDLKQFLASVYPTQPSVNSQRLIYNGRLLQNNWCLKDVLDCVGVNSPVIHLVCSPNCDNCCVQDVRATSKPVVSGSKEDMTRASRSSHNAIAGSSSRAALDASLPAAAATAAAPVIGFPAAPCSSSAFSLGTNVSMTTCVSSPAPVVCSSQAPTATLLHAYKRSDATTSVKPSHSNERIVSESFPMSTEYSNIDSACAGLDALPSCFRQSLEPTGFWIQYQQQLAHMHHMLTWQYYAYLQNQNFLSAASQQTTSLSSDRLSHPHPAAAAEGVRESGRPVDNRVDNDVQRAMDAMEEDNDNENGVEDERDRGDNWTDLFYTMCRVALLLAFVFAYSTVERFFLVGTFAVLIYVLNAGWLQVVEVIEAAAEDEGPDAQLLAEVMGTATISPSWQVCWCRRLIAVINTVTLFFTTLLPNQPLPGTVNGN